MMKKKKLKCREEEVTPQRKNGTGQRKEERNVSPVSAVREEEEEEECSDEEEDGEGRSHSPDGEMTG